MSGKMTATPALALDIILPLLVEFYFRGRGCTFLQGDANFRRLEFRCRRIEFVKEVAESSSNIPVSMNALAMAFERSRSRVQPALAHRLDPPDTEESREPSIEIVNNKSLIGISRTQNKTHQSRKEESEIITQLNSRSQTLEDWQIYRSS
jgi:hypothetical protein